jgi:O-antigen/teichoic acid export membrane protein
VQCAERLRRGFLLPEDGVVKVLDDVPEKPVANTMKDLKEKTIRGGLARICAQAATFLLRIGSLIILARLLGPKDFGLLGMVTAFTGVLTLFRDFGLSSATVQRPTITEEQISTLFWINILVGAVLAILTIASAPMLAALYHEPRILGVTLALAAGFLFNAVGVQHSALLQREMRYTALAVINVVALIVSSAVGIGGARAGYGYWALVAMNVVSPLVGTLGLCFTSAWVPGMPRRQAGVRSMIRFGGTITLNSLVVYIASNLEKVLLGRFWGVEAIGIYGRAYQLVNIPTDNLNSAIGEVAFSALSRLQDDPGRLKSYFLKGYSLVLALTLPITIACALFADDIVLVLLGPKWKAASPILRLLAPTILVFAIANPLSWLLSAIGLVERNLKLALFIAPTMIGGYVIALPQGPKGVAFAYSAVLTLWLVPLIAWCVHGTVISFWDILLVVSRPLAASVLAAVVAFGMQLLYGRWFSPLPRLALGVTILLGVYLGTLLLVMGQQVFLSLLRGLMRRSSVEEKALVSA